MKEKIKNIKEKEKTRAKNFFSSNNNFFKSKQLEFLFYLIKLEGKQRNKFLKLTDEHYQNKILAKKWYKEISKYVHPDKGGDAKAFIVLTDIYKLLIEED